MNKLPKEKLERIAEIWNHYIWKYKFCNSKLKFNDDLRTNYFGDIFSYFSDTFSVLERQYESKSFRENFEHSISFLQAIYIQQDFIEELHFIFKTKIVKGDLKEDPNYSLNREIRNESIGHPIRKTIIQKTPNQIEKCASCGSLKETIQGKKVLLSSILFSIDVDSDNIKYLKYHRDNNFQFQEIKYSKEDILNRHYEFLNQNFDLVIDKLKKILRPFLRKLKEINQIKEQIPIENLIQLVTDSFEYILKTDYLFDSKILIELFNRKDEHLRYKVALDVFYNDLSIFLNESINDIEEFLEDKDRFSNPNYFKDKFGESTEEVISVPITQKESYSYELGKLVNQYDERCNFFITVLERRCKENSEAINEINHLKSNRYNHLEYYSSYALLRKILKED